MTCSSSTTFIARRFALAFLALALSGPVRGDAPVDLVAKAKAALARHDGIAAEAPLRAAIGRGVPPDDVRAELGESLMLQGDRREARKVLYGGDFPSASAAHGWQLRGRVELLEGRLAEAGRAFDQSYRLAPDNASLWVDIARLRFSGGEQAQAIEAAERAVKLDSRDPRALELRGLLVREQFGLQASLPWFEAGLRVAPDDPGLLGEYAATLGDMGQYRAMLIVCRKLAKVDPGNVRALYLQAVLAARAGQTSLARRILLQTGTALRDMPAAILLNGILEYRAGNANLAVGHFDRLLRVQPDNLQVRQMMVRALERQGLHQQAADVAAAWWPQAFAPPYLLALAADAQAGLGNRTGATTLRERARASGQRPAAVISPGQPLPVLALAYADAPNYAANAVPYIRGLLESGDAGKAVAVADRLRMANPGAAEAWLLSGDARLMAGDRAGALDQYGRAATIRFNLPTLQRIDHVLRLMGKPAEANSVLARYLRQNPGNPQALKLLSAGRAAFGERDGAERIEQMLRQRGFRNPS